MVTENDEYDQIILVTVLIRQAKRSYGVKEILNAI